MAIDTSGRPSESEMANDERATTGRSVRTAREILKEPSKIAVSQGPVVGFPETWNGMEALWILAGALRSWSEVEGRGLKVEG
jgi:hypothetical protein